MYQSQGDSLIWEQVHSLVPTHSPYFIQTNLGLPGQPQIAFSPDGSTGYVAFLGDLAGGSDSTYSLIWIKTTDGGNTWTQPEEFDMRQFPALITHLQQITDSAGNPSGTGIPTTAYDFDLVVDANNTPHFFTLVANGLEYTVQSELKMSLFDFTKDSFGDWNMVFISDQSTFRWEWGNNPSSVALDTRIQASRSLDGNIISVYWTDTDTTEGNSSSINDRPDLLGRALNIQTQLSSPIFNFSTQDSIWKGKIIMPKVSPTSFIAGDVYTSPTVFLDAPNGGFSECSYYYTGQVGFSITTNFTEPIAYFYNCQENPFSNSITQIQPSCGMSDGALSVDIVGGVGPYDTQWLYDGGILTDTLMGLANGVYSAIVTDSMTCTDTLQIILNDENGPQITIDSSSIMAVSCFGVQDGAASISVSGATAPYTYLWSNGEQTATADSLWAGVDTVIVTDAQSCVSRAIVTIEGPLPLAISALIQDISCYGSMDGSLEIIANGGNGGFQFHWDAPSLSDSSLVGNLPPGTYPLSIIDSNGCTLRDSFSIASPDSLVLTTTSGTNTQPQVPYNGTATGVAFGGTAAYIYSWSYIGECTGYSFTGDSTFADGLLAGNYAFSATDMNGCTATDTVTVLGISCLTISIQGDQEESPTFKLYPNPTSEAFTLQIVPADRAPIQVGLFDLNGQAIEVRVLNGQIRYTEDFHTSQLPSGLYLLQVTSKMGKHSRRVMIY